MVPFGTVNWFHLACFRNRSQLEPHSRKWVARFQVGPKECDWGSFSALLLFSCIPARQVSSAQLPSINSNWNRSRVNARPIRANLVQFRMELSCVNDALNIFVAKLVIER